MRSACSALVLLCAVACGNLSNEDVAFIEAIPQKDELHVVVPQGDTAQPACAIASADIAISARTTGNAINSGVDGILGLVDAIRAALLNEVRTGGGHNAVTFTPLPCNSSVNASENAST